VTQKKAEHLEVVLAELEGKKKEQAIADKLDVIIEKLETQNIMLTTLMKLRGYV